MSQTELISSEQQKLDKLVEKLKYFKSKLLELDYTHNQKEYMDVMNEFSSYIRSIKDEELCDIFFHSKYFSMFHLFFKEKSAYHWRSLEASETLGIITKGAHQHTGFEYLLSDASLKDKYISKDNYFNHIDMSSKKKIVCVGCGSMPETMIYLYEKYGTQEIIGIDNNIEAVYMSNQLIGHLGVTNIKAIYADGTTYDYADADLVYIAALVSPKDKVVSRIAETSGDNIEIVAIVPRFLNGLIHDSIIISKHPRLRMKELYLDGDHSGSGKKSVLLTKYKY